MRVLVADDSKSARVLLQKQLLSWGYEPILAEDGQEALEILQGENAPRLAILDWLMPRLDGIDVCRQIKEDPNTEFTYVIILSSRDEEDDMVAGLSAGADDYLPKSSNPIMLRSHLKAASRILDRVPPRAWSKPKVDGYTVERLIGKGACATVWKAVHDSSGRDVALKIMRMDLSTEGVFSRFAREIKLMEKLQHPNIARVFDSRIDRSMGYCALEYIDGWPLQKYLKEHTVKKPQMFDIVIQLCGGLQHAHDNGVIHRDVKPSNIMMTKAGQPKLVDFGLGRNLFRADADHETSQTMEGYVIGTPMYMAPEQARGENESLDGRADLYALGILLYVALVRRHPHDVKTDSRSETINEVAHGTARRPSELHPDFDPVLEQILMRALAHEPDDRYRKASELAADLKKYASTNF